MDGWEATRRLKADDRTKGIPVVALTGHALAGHSEGAKEAGCDSFLTKPWPAGCDGAEVRAHARQEEDEVVDGGDTEADEEQAVEERAEPARDQRHRLERRARGHRAVAPEATPKAAG